MTMTEQTDYSVLTHTLVAHFGERLKMIVLFAGSRSHGEAHSDSDHDIFVVIEDLPAEPPGASADRDDAAAAGVAALLPAQISMIAKTPHELLGALTPLVVISVLMASVFMVRRLFENLRGKVLQSLNAAD